MNPMILIADDEGAIRQLLRCMFSQAGIDVLEASNGIEAVELYLQHRPHLVLLDLDMPLLDGQSALREIRKHDPGAHACFMTGGRKPDTDITVFGKPFDSPMGIVESLVGLLQQHYPLLNFADG